MTTPDRVAVHIDRLVVETDHKVDGFALQLALGPAIQQVVTERGLPAAWRHNAAVSLAGIGEVDWDGTGGEPALARALAERLHERVRP